MRKRRDGVAELLLERRKGKGDRRGKDPALDSLRCNKSTLQNLNYAHWSDERRQDAKSSSSLG